MDLSLSPERQKALDERLAEMDANLEREQSLSRRAKRIADRLMPSPPSAHGFYEPEAFIHGRRHAALKARLYWMIRARLHAKAEGLPHPRIDLPRDDHALRGGPLWQVAKFLEEQAKWQ